MVNKYIDFIKQINLFEDKFKLLSDNELRAKTYELKKRYQTDLQLNSCISESFALTREASYRTLGLKHFDVQLMGGLTLNNQKIAEMRTGEGKTLVATLPACLNAITNKGVHIVTVNEYLAQRDQGLMDPIYRFLGLKAGLVQTHMSTVQKKRNYQKDITYVTNYELTFDFLRDNMALNINDVVLRPFNYCIIDEVDSILIDEAQTPLIISNNIETPVDKYIIAAEIVTYLKRDIHFQVDEKKKNIVLTEKGSLQIEKILKVQNLYNSEDPWIPYIINALKASTLFFENFHYIIQKNRIIIVDEFTGRTMTDRRWGDGLHQAIEAKEKLPIRKKTETVATITYQNFFLTYPKLSGMTGTGKTSELEFEKIYKLSVEEIPTAKLDLRVDLPDRIYKDQFSKWTAITKSCAQISSTGQPILIGTTTIDKSEMLAQLLNEYKLQYQLLNARPENIRRESEIIAQAGEQEAITIATNMAGRGTDIILGGNVNFTIQKKLYNILTLSKYSILKNKSKLVQSKLKLKLSLSSQKALSIIFSLIKTKNFLQLSDIDILRILQKNDKISNRYYSSQVYIWSLINELTFYSQKHQDQKNQIVKNLGGLYVIGTERNNSKRIDNQLRGRCGRQGDPGTTRFFLSLDDDLLRLFGGPKIQDFMKQQIDNDTPLESNFLTTRLNFAQQRVEERSYEQRKNLFEYDEILNDQRQIVYFERRQILESLSLSLDKKILIYGEQIITELVANWTNQKYNNQYVISVLENLFEIDSKVKDLINLDQQTKDFNLYEAKQYLFNEFWLTYLSKRNELSIYGDNICEKVSQTTILINIDQLWREHLQTMSLLREAVGWRSYGQVNPLYEYRKDAYSLFKRIKKNLRNLTLYNILRSSIL